jgi:hypothetical protein
LEGITGSNRVLGKRIELPSSPTVTLKILTKKDGQYYLIQEAIESFDKIDWRSRKDEVEQGSNSQGKIQNQTIKDPNYVYRLPSPNPKKAGERKKRLRGE